MKVHIGKYKDDDSERKIDIKIHKWDSWSADHTLALIAVPLLKQLAENKQGVPTVMFPDGPEWLDETGNHNDAAMEVAVDKWDTTLRHIIWSLEQVINEELDAFVIQHAEFDFDDHPEDEGKDVFPLRWKVEGKYRVDAMGAYDDQIQVGLDYFGKYFRNLWC